jgi:hypothetical protein
MPMTHCSKGPRNFFTALSALSLSVPIAFALMGDGSSRTDDSSQDCEWTEWPAYG